MALRLSQQRQARLAGGAASREASRPGHGARTFGRDRADPPAGARARRARRRRRRRGARGDTRRRGRQRRRLLRRGASGALAVTPSSRTWSGTTPCRSRRAGAAGRSPRPGPGPPSSPGPSSRAREQAEPGSATRRPAAVWHANLGPIHTPQMQAVLRRPGRDLRANRQDGDKVKAAAVLTPTPAWARPPRRSRSAGRSTAARSSSTGRDHQRRPRAHPGRLHRADLEHDHPQPQRDVVPVLRPSRSGEGQRRPAGQPGRRLRALSARPD